jgi:DNA-binding HxlR family transcriptional regulator
MASTCPINASLVVLGDRWSLLVVRDLMFAGYRSFNQFLHAGEGIATNILADRIEKLIDAGIITKGPDPDDGRKWIYALTSKGIDLAPVLLELSKWASRYQNGIAPEGILERWEADRAGLLAELRSRLGTPRRLPDQGDKAPRASGRARSGRRPPSDPIKRRSRSPRRGS